MTSGLPSTLGELRSAVQAGGVPRRSVKDEIRENLIAREEVDRLQGLRGTYGIKAPAPICADPSEALVVLDAGDPALCQVVQAPAGDAQRLVPIAAAGTPADSASRALPARASLDEDRAATEDGREIRLTYRELSALIEDAIRSLR